MDELEIKCKELRSRQDILSEISGKLNRALEKAKDEYMAELKRAVREVADGRADIHNWVDSHRDLFAKTRSRTVHGIKVGLQKGKGKIECDNEDRAMDYIYKYLKPEEHEVLIKRTEKLNKTALNDVDAMDLRKMGVRIVQTGDKVIVKDADGEIEKLVASMLKEKEKEARGDEQ